MTAYTYRASDGRLRSYRYEPRRAEDRCPNQPPEENEHAPATDQVGARAYCWACADSFRRFLHSREIVVGVVA